MTATTEFEMLKHSPAGLADIEMGEPAGVIAQPDNVRFSLALRSSERSFT
jgi:hypothetical protein